MPQLSPMSWLKINFLILMFFQSMKILNFGLFLKPSNNSKGLPIYTIDWKW